ncbi:TPA: hypothetical protein ACNVDZ_005303 [Citrobacter freundii]
MKFTLHQDQMRVTSIPYSSTKMVIFSGVPLKKNSHKTNSGKYYVTIKADPDAIPVQPALGQHWSVKGTRLVEEVETGDFVMQQHTYESPGNDSNLLIVFYVQIMPDDLVMQLHRF